MKRDKIEVNDRQVAMCIYVCMYACIHLCVVCKYLCKHGACIVGKK